MTNSLWSLANTCLETLFLLLQKRKLCAIVKNILAVGHEDIFCKFFWSFWESHWKPLNNFRCLILPKSLGFYPQFFHPAVFCLKARGFSSFTSPFNFQILVAASCHAQQLLQEQILYYSITFRRVSRAAFTFPWHKFDPKTFLIEHVFFSYITLESLKQLLLWSASLLLWTALLFLTEQQVEPFSVGTFVYSHTVQGCCNDFICTCFINCLGYHLMALIHVADTAEIILLNVKTTGTWPSYFQLTLEVSGFISVAIS